MALPPPPSEDGRDAPPASGGMCCSWCYRPQKIAPPHDHEVVGKVHDTKVLWNSKLVPMLTGRVLVLGTPSLELLLFLDDPDPFLPLFTKAIPDM